MILISKLLSSCALGLTLLVSPVDPTEVAETQSQDTSNQSVVAEAAVSIESAPDVPGGSEQIEGLKQWDDMTLTTKGGGNGGTLSASWILNGKVMSFWLNGTRYDWLDGCYQPMYPKRMWHYYKFRKISPGVYEYEKHSLGHGDPLMESGSAVPTDG